MKIKFMSLGVLFLSLSALGLLTTGCGDGIGGALGEHTEAPAITTHPASHTIGDDASTSFTVVATGSAPLTYQWQKNGEDITGATSSTYTIAKVGFVEDNNCSFRCIVTNAHGNATSNTATLTVTPIETKLTASDGAAGDQMGFAVTAENNIIVTGALHANSKGTIYVYKYSSDVWTETILIPSDGTAGDWFGYSVDISDDSIIVGAPHKSTQKGAIYIYKWNGLTWNEKKCVASDTADNDQYGHDVAIENDMAVSGAHYRNSYTGAAYVLKLNDSAWIETNIITASDAATGDRYGRGMSLFNGRISIGAYANDDKGADSGSAYLYDWNGSSWVETKFVASDGTAGDGFGIGLSIGNNICIVGSHTDDAAATSAGSVYFNKWNGSSWIETKALPTDLTTGDTFGHAIALNNELVAIGARLHDSAGTDAGTVYIYDINANLKQKLVASDAAVSDEYGVSVGITNSFLAIGAYKDDDKGTDSGSAYVYGTPELEALTILEHPADATAPEGSTARFEIDVTGSMMYLYQWQLSTDDGATWSDIALNANLYHYTTPSLSAADQHNQYRCVATNPVGSVTSSAATLTVLVETKLLASDGGVDDHFGNKIAISNNVVVVGAHAYEPTRSKIGSAYVYNYDGTSWNELKLIPADGAAGDEFGCNVAISDDIIVIGVRNDDDKGGDSGSAYVYKWDGGSWIEQQKLTASDGAATDYFGQGVAISGDTIVVGAFYGDDVGSNSGTAYVFRWNGTSWVETQKLTASDGAADDWFGTNVFISGDTIIVGSHGDDDNGSNSGAAYVFKWDGSSWQETQKLTASDGATDDYFSSGGFGLSGDTIVVSANGDDDNGEGSGSSYIFKWNGSIYQETQKINASDGAASDNFSAVSISGDTIVVGAQSDDDNGADSGSAYIFKWNGSTWQETNKIIASDGSTGDFFGGTVAVESNVLAVGATFDAELGSNSGSAYVYGTPTLVAPTIDTHPADTIGMDSGTVSFSVDVSGSMNLTYQWQLSTDGGNIWNDIAAANLYYYTTPTLAPADDGNQYRCIATNMVDSATSNAATLTIPTTYKIINLSTNAITEADAIPDLLSNDIYKTTHLVLKYIAPGTFQMGDIAGTGEADERPVHTVNITKGYYMGVFEVTQKQWQLVKGSWPSNFTTLPDKLPVEMVSWEDSAGSGGFLDTISGSTGLNFRLPTEAEWEYACRAGTSTKYSYGDTEDGAYMWYTVNASSTTNEVGTKLPNPWGLYDIHGNVFEWCSDWYSDTYYGTSPADDPENTTMTNNDRVRRGGSWNTNGADWRSASRIWAQPTDQVSFIGFRVVLEP